jgi:hypothetical protein
MSTFLLGAKAIAGHLKKLGLIEEDDPNAEDKVYTGLRPKELRPAASAISCSQLTTHYSATPTRRRSRNRPVLDSHRRRAVERGHSQKSVTGRRGR